MGEGHEPGSYPSSCPSDLTVILCKRHGDQGLHTQHVLTGIGPPMPPPPEGGGAVQDPVSEVTVQALPAAPTTVLPPVHTWFAQREIAFDLLATFVQTANVVTGGPAGPCDPRTP